MSGALFLGMERSIYAVDVIRVDRNHLQSMEKKPRVLDKKRLEKIMV